MHYRNSLITAAALLMFGISGGAVQAEPKVGDSMRVLSMYWSKQDPEETARRLQFAANMVAGRVVEADLEEQLLKEHDAFRKWSAPFSDAPELKVKVIPRYDEIRVLNRTLVDKFVAEDIGEQKAVRIAKSHLEQLIDAGMLSQKTFDMRDVQVGYGRIIEGSKDGKQKRDAVTEYRVTFRPNIAGVQLANAGVRIAVHRSGALAGLRFGGVSTDEDASDSAVRTVSLERADRLMRETLPDNSAPEIAWSRIMYVMPDDTPAAILEPMQVYAYSVKTKSDGYEVVSRRKIVGVSLSSGSVVDYTPPAAKHEGQLPQRKETM